MAGTFLKLGEMITFIHFQKVTVLIGEPINYYSTLEDCRRLQYSAVSMTFFYLFESLLVLMISNILQRQRKVLLCVPKKYSCQKIAKFDKRADL